MPPANPLKNRLNTLTYYYIHSIIALNNKSCLYTLINHNKPLYTVTYAYIPQISSNFYSSQRKVKNHNHSKRSANVSINLSLFVCQKNFHPLVHCSPTTLHLFYTKGCHALLACGLTSSSPQRVHFTHNRRPKTKEPPISLSCPTFSFSMLSFSDTPAGLRGIVTSSNLNYFNFIRNLIHLLSSFSLLFFVFFFSLLNLIISSTEEGHFKSGSCDLCNCGIVIVGCWCCVLLLVQQQKNSKNVFFGYC